MVEVEKGQDWVQVFWAREGRRLNWYVEPIRRRIRIISIATLRLSHLHVNTKGIRLKVEHDSLLPEPEGLVGLSDHRVDILVYGLLQVNFRWVYLVDMLFDVGESDYTLSEFESWPPALDTVSSTFLHNLCDSKVFVLKFLLIHGCADSLLELCYSSNFLKQRFKET